MEENADMRDVERLVHRLRRVEGQCRGLQRMIQAGRPCEEIFTQLTATRAALDSAGVLLISLKMRECLSDTDATADAAVPAAVEKALETFLMYARSVR